VVFEDGSKMNIFSSKLDHIQLQNANLGGVNYEKLRLEGEGELEEGRIRSRTNTNPENYCRCFQTSEEREPSFHFTKSLEAEQKTLNSFSSSGNKNSSDSYNSFSIDQQFLELARESEEFRELEKESQKGEFKTRLKSKTMIPNPNLEQFLKENSPCKVLFVRSIPEVFGNRHLYNIFANFGSVRKVIHLKEKGNGLVEFECIEDAITAKDELNYAKPEMKVFYSHYESLSMTEGEGETYCNEKKEPTGKSKFVNPPSEVLYLTMVVPQQ
jgi:RNA recognition motif-containing protein